MADANKTVYVYNTSGGLLGSWAAGGLNGSAQVEGIATNGTDVWILDNKTDKVYKYTGAATRLSGSQSAAGSFSLNSGNTNGKGVVTDGASLWVVNDGTTDAVFKYTLSGTLLGSWTIDAANASPTGLTINPANVSDIWIVDNGTKKVYQYTGAASRTSGSQNAAATFALAPGDTNPQGIADPPPAEEMLPTVNDPISRNSASAATPDTTPLVGVPLGAAVPSLTVLDAVFAMLARESRPLLGGSSSDFMSVGVGSSRLENRTAVAGPESTPPMTSGEEKPLRKSPSRIGFPSGVRS